MIFYFSGTGNSRYVAEKTAETVQDEVVSMNALLKEGKAGTFISEKPYVFVLPVYAGRMPRVVEHCIEKMQLEGNSAVYFIMTCFETPYASEKYIRRLCGRKHLELSGFDYVCMPQSYIAMYDVPDHDQAVQIYRKALPKITEMAEKIRRQEKFDHQVNGGGMMSDVINPVFYQMAVSAKGFHTTDRCTGCGLCAERCPLNNIRLQDKVPQWGNSCTHCMACIDGCPAQAIEYKKATARKSRNYNIAADL